MYFRRFFAWFCETFGGGGILLRSKARVATFYFESRTRLFRKATMRDYLPAVCTLALRADLLIYQDSCACSLSTRWASLTAHSLFISCLLDMRTLVGHIFFLKIYISKKLYSLFESNKVSSMRTGWSVPQGEYLLFVSFEI